jgi:hypothetical protein
MAVPPNDTVPVYNFYLDERLTSVKFSPKLLFAVVEIADCLHVALLDTGASINVVPEDLAQDIETLVQIRTRKTKVNAKFLGNFEVFWEAKERL